VIYTAARAGLIISVGVAAIWALRQIVRGEVLVRDQDDPGILISRKERPVVFWSFFAFFYAVLIAVAGTAALLP